MRRSNLTDVGLPSRQSTLPVGRTWVPTWVAVRETLLAALPALLSVLLLLLATQPAYNTLLDNGNGWSPHAYQALAQDVQAYQVARLDPAQSPEARQEVLDRALSSTGSPAQFTGLGTIEGLGEARLGEIDRLLRKNTPASVAQATTEAIKLNAQANTFAHERGAEYLRALADMRRGLMVAAVVTGVLSMLLTLRGLLLWRAERRQRARREARQREALGMASHELRRPLQALLLASDLLRHADTPEQRQRLLTMIEDHATQLAHRADLTRLNDLYLDVSLQMTRTDLVDVLRRVVEDTGHRVRLNVPDAPLVWPVDSNRVRQMIENLIENALKYTDGPVEVTLRGHQGQPEVLVRDWGQGIAAHQREQVFLPYERGPLGLSQAAASGGTGGGQGLGLSLVRRYARAHGGDVRIEDAPDGPGTLIRVQLGTPSGAALDA